MADVVFNSIKKGLMDRSSNGVDLDTDTLKVMLVTSSYVPDQDAHDFVNDVTNEAVGTGYTAGGQVLTNKGVTQDNTNNRAAFTADPSVWTGSTITARGAVLYKDTGTPSTSPLIAYYDFGGNIISSGGPFTITWNASGLLLLS